MYSALVSVPIGKVHLSLKERLISYFMIKNTKMLPGWEVQSCAETAKYLDLENSF